MTDYTFVTQWEVDAPRDRVWDALLDVRRWPDWWQGFRSVEVLDPGGDGGVGMVLRQRWRSLVPYTLSFDLEIVTVDRRHRLQGRMSGDVEGLATWTIEETGVGTRVGLVMEISPARAWMRLPLPFAGRIFAVNYNAIMRWGGQGLARLVGRTGTRATEGAQLGLEGA